MTPIDIAISTLPEQDQEEAQYLLMERSGFLIWNGMDEEEADFEAIRLFRL